jgi:hypothetical protein
MAVIPGMMNRQSLTGDKKKLGCSRPDTKKGWGNSISSLLFHLARSKLSPPSKVVPICTRKPPPMVANDGKSRIATFSKNIHKSLIQNELPLITAF